MSHELSVTHKRNYLRITLIIILTLIAVPLVYFAAMTTQSLFVRAEDKAPGKVTIDSVGKTTAHIAWFTDKPAQSVVEYGVSPGNLNSYSPEPVPVTEHAVDLTLLTPATTYFFQIRVDTDVYTNDGSPWTFTTKTTTGEDVSSQVRGIATRIKKKQPPEPTSTPVNCAALSCEEVQSHLGRGCTVKDYVRCMSSNSSVTNSPQATITLAPTQEPNPTSILIKSNICKLQYLQPDKNSTLGCTGWTWDPVAVKTKICRDAFDRYVFECRNTSFESYSGPSADEVWYFRGAIDDIASNSASLQLKPSSGTTIYCQVRAEDEVGGDAHATDWMRMSKKCQ